MTRQMRRRERFDRPRLQYISSDHFRTTPTRVKPTVNTPAKGGQFLRSWDEWRRGGLSCAKKLRASSSSLPARLHGPQQVEGADGSGCGSTEGERTRADKQASRRAVGSSHGPQVAEVAAVAAACMLPWLEAHVPANPSKSQQVPAGPGSTQQVPKLVAAESPAVPGARPQDSAA